MDNNLKCNSCIHYCVCKDLAEMVSRKYKKPIPPDAEKVDRCEYFALSAPAPAGEGKEKELKSGAN